ncbi:hypothetical protein FB451DRAFT_1550563 [Mycena latifolia]|nr:hypothetical protein FB451DRAFT_1550563 [Mycena latifolia]
MHAPSPHRRVSDPSSGSRASVHSLPPPAGNPFPIPREWLTVVSSSEYPPLHRPQRHDLTVLIDSALISLTSDDHAYASQALLTIELDRAPAETATFAKLAQSTPNSAPTRSPTRLPHHSSRRRPSSSLLHPALYPPSISMPPPFETRRQATGPEAHQLQEGYAARLQMDRRGLIWRPSFILAAVFVASQSRECHGQQPVRKQESRATFPRCLDAPASRDRLSALAAAAAARCILRRAPHLKTTRRATAACEMDGPRHLPRYLIAPASLDRSLPRRLKTTTKTTTLPFHHRRLQLREGHDAKTKMCDRQGRLADSHAAVLRRRLLPVFVLGADSRTTPTGTLPPRSRPHPPTTHCERPSFAPRSFQSFLFHHGQQASPPPRHPASGSVPAIIVFCVTSLSSSPPPLPPRRSSPAGGPVCSLRSSFALPPSHRRLPHFRPGARLPLVVLFAYAYAANAPNNC